MTERPLETLAPTIYQFQCLDAIEASEILHQAMRLTAWRSAPIRKGQTGSDRLAEDVRSAWELKASEAPEVFATFSGKIVTRVTEVAAQLSASELELSELRLVRYDEGGFFKIHSDTGAGDRRRFAIVIYLNDDFSGGATIFPLIGCRAVPKQGKALVFPANRLHRGDVVTGGQKFILVMWLLDRQESSPSPSQTLS